jgi:hypothetical protein
MKVYIDNEYRCYVSHGEGLREIEAPEFDGFCTEFIEGMRLVPEGESWVREDGEVFNGRMKSPWKDFGKLEKAQLAYELAQLKAELADADAALNELGVNIDG